MTPTMASAMRNKPSVDFCGYLVVNRHASLKTSPA
jgi:hypothetical protein